MTNVVHSILLLGPSGTGKSSLAASAAAALGGAAIALAPGDNERNSYVHLLDHGDNSRYMAQGFNDADFLPSIGELQATGHKQLIMWLRGLYKLIQEDVKAGKPPRFPLLILDTFSAMATLGYNATLSKFGKSEAPKARGDEGAPFYGTLKSKLEEIMRLAEAIRGLGVHLIVISHVAERENVSEAANAITSSRMIVPAIPGGFRDTFASLFDGVFYTGVIAVTGKPPAYYLQWRGDPKRPTKSRLGSLGTGDKVANDWLSLTTALEASVAARITPAA